MGPPRNSYAGQSNSRKRKKPDEEEVLLARGILNEDPIENEYENLDEDDEEQEVITLSKEKGEFEKILKAQEPSTISQYGDIKVTGYNLEDEREDGEFDEMGNFIFRKSSPTDDELNDTWVESVDWEAVRRRENEARERKSARDEEKQVNETKDAKTDSILGDRFTCYRQMLRIMRPDETVQKSIRRLGNEVPKRRPTNRNKAQQSTQTNEDDEGDKQAKIAEARKKLDNMIELAHHLLEDGDTDIYQKSYEDLEEAIN